MATERQTRASIRNWTKMRLMGMQFPTKYMTVSEILCWNEIQANIKEMLKDWDKNTKQL